jgi:hypothetical protein
MIDIFEMTTKQFLIWLLQCAFLLIGIGAIFLAALALFKYGIYVIEYQHALQTAAISNCTMYNANSTNGSFCLV